MPVPIPLLTKSLLIILAWKGSQSKLGLSLLQTVRTLWPVDAFPFTLSPVEGYGEDIDVNEAYVLPDLNKSQQVFPETVDIQKYPHL